MMPSPATRSIPVPRRPLRLGVLGAARIAGRSLIPAATAAGDVLVAVAARDPQRAREYAAEHGFLRAESDYAALLRSPDIEAVYVPLVNSEHAEWAARALDAGKHVLVEKPIAANADQMEALARRAAGSGLVLAEAFHYAMHPLWLRVHEVLGSGQLGTVQGITIRSEIPAPADSDPRWSLALAGGSVMDVGCYALHAAESLGAHFGGTPRVVSATALARPEDAEVDRSLTAELTYPDGTPVHVSSSMDAADMEFSLRITGTAGALDVPDFVLPQLDDRLIFGPADAPITEHLGTRASFDFQLDAFRAAVRGDATFPVSITESLHTLRLVDAAYRAAGLAPRPGAELSARV
ncbi:gfo/Idh/MocA family oxidoreductase [Mycetocola tolaasinivorans]|uniref:Gfo/Idh/MocA family oxidoreductase n=1 Tax=Mycetocola tolaasinivorans TaxID=76635 RepID=A0A3L7A5L9_9MICO|nr:Gfo/Idh/MocA family oxidoreductase [Mycetocola tolaasinivorans]RLP75527.1 gfo/Idh/MocA family oxidoreductase [Mycetocola tolaasinivorans]